jgi:hypothetical protein
MHYEVSYDISRFLDASIDKVVHTLGRGLHIGGIRRIHLLGRLAIVAHPVSRGAVSL